MSRPAKRADRVGYPLRRFPESLKNALAAQAAEQGTNLNDVAVAILATTFGVNSFSPSGRKSAGLSTSTYINLEMPERLRRRINSKAADQGRTGRELIIEVLAASLGIVATA